MKKFFIITIIIIGIVALLPLLNRRSVSARVYDVNENSVIFEDKTGNLWKEENNNFSLNEKVILILNDKGTESILDDEIIKVKRGK